MRNFDLAKKPHITFEDGEWGFFGLFGHVEFDNANKKCSEFTSMMNEKCKKTATA